MYSKFNYISIFFVVIPIKIYNASIYYDFYYLDMYAVDFISTKRYGGHHWPCSCVF